MTTDTKDHSLDDNRWVVKALMRLFATFIGFMAMCLFASAIGYENANYVNVSGNGDWPDGLALAPIILSMLFNPIAFVMHLWYRKSSSIHPAVRIVMDLIVWVLSAAALVLCIGSGMFWLWTPATPSDDGTIDCLNIFNIWSEDCAPVAYRIGRLQIAGIVFLGILFFCHLVLFVFACVDLRRRQLVRKLQSDQFEMSYDKDPEQRSQGS